MSEKQQIFITGTDTGVGKTWVSAAILEQAHRQGKAAAYYKPIQTGSPPGEPPEDPAFIDKALKHAVPTYNRYCFEPPVTPSVADVEGIINLDRIRGDITHYARNTDILVVEGAGGLCVPISKTMLMIDLIEALQIPALLVAHSRLGTMNHTLLSLRALQQRDIPILGVMFNFYPADLSQAEIATQTLLDAIQPHLPPHLPVWISMGEKNDLENPHFETTFSLDKFAPTHV